MLAQILFYFSCAIFRIMDTGSREITVFIPVVFLSYCKLVRKMTNIVEQDEMLQNGHLISTFHSLHAG